MARQSVRVWVAAALSSLLLQSAALAAPLLPEKVFAPPPGKGVPYKTEPNLSSDYREQEFLISGSADVYGYDDKRKPIVTKASQPYTTRILVRYPKDPQRFSGTVIFEVLHPEFGLDFLWQRARDYIVRSGDAYVQVTTRREARNPTAPFPADPVPVLKKFDPERYGAISYDDGGLTWDIMSQVGRLVKSRAPENPLRELPVKQTVVGGWSGAGALVLFYINEGFHERARLDGGAPLFDAYLVGEPSWYPRINSAMAPAQDLPDDDPRQKVQPRDVPAISLYSMALAQMKGMGRLRPDSDAANDRYRLYPIGATHGQANMPGCDYPSSEFPLDHYFALTLDYLKRWSRDAVVPPHAQPFEYDSNGALALDEHGNARGGVRSVAVDVPIARHFSNKGAPFCFGAGAQEKFSAEKLRQLYGSGSSYAQRVETRAKALVSAGWLLSADADALIADAKQEAVVIDAKPASEAAK